MARSGQMAIDFEHLGEWVYPRLVGTLVLCGDEPGAAATLVERVMWRAQRQGLAGGTDATRLIVEDVLQSARPPGTTRVPEDAVEGALATTPWKERLATVAPAALGDLARDADLGPAADPVALAAALQLADPDELPARLAEAVDHHAPAPEPDLLARLRRRATRRRLRIAIPAVVVVAALVIVAILIGRTSSGSSSSHDSITQWVAVLDVGPSFAALGPEALTVGAVAGVYVFIDQWVCYADLPPDAPTDRGAWFLGVAADRKDTVDGIVSQLDKTPLFEAQLRQGCLPDPSAPTATSTS